MDEEIPPGWDVFFTSQGFFLANPSWQRHSNRSRRSSRGYGAWGYFCRMTTALGICIFLYRFLLLKPIWGFIWLSGDVWLAESAIYLFLCVYSSGFEHKGSIHRSLLLICTRAGSRITDHSGSTRDNLVLFVFLGRSPSITPQKLEIVLKMYPTQYFGTQTTFRHAGERWKPLVIPLLLWGSAVVLTSANILLGFSLL